MKLKAIIIDDMDAARASLILELQENCPNIDVI